MLRPEQERWGGGVIGDGIPHFPTPGSWTLNVLTASLLGSTKTPTTTDSSSLIRSNLTISTALSPALFLAISASTRENYCEKCDVWTKSRDQMQAHL